LVRTFCEDPVDRAGPLWRRIRPGSWLMRCFAVHADTCGCNRCYRRRSTVAATHRAPPPVRTGEILHDEAGDYALVQVIRIADNTGQGNLDSWFKHAAEPAVQQQALSSLAATSTLRPTSNVAGPAAPEVNGSRSIGGDLQPTAGTVVQDFASPSPLSSQTAQSSQPARAAAPLLARPHAEIRGAAVSSHAGSVSPELTEGGHDTVMHILSLHGHQLDTPDGTDSQSQTLAAACGTAREPCDTIAYLESIAPVWDARQGSPPALSPILAPMLAPLLPQTSPFPVEPRWPGAPAPPPSHDQPLTSGGKRAAKKRQGPPLQDVINTSWPRPATTTDSTSIQTFGRQTRPKSTANERPGKGRVGGACHEPMAAPSNKRRSVRPGPSSSMSYSPVVTA
jgi:hypothetical protein